MIADADAIAFMIRKNTLHGITYLLIGAVLFLTGISFIFVAENADKREQDEAVDIYFASEADEYVSADVQYMTDYIAAYDAMDNMRLYITCDSDWNPAVICMHTDDLPLLQPYMDWLYGEGSETQPQEISVSGYAQPYDDELKEFVIEGFASLAGEGVVDEKNFEEWFGGYYLQLGQKSSSFKIAKYGSWFLLGAVLLLFFGSISMKEASKLSHLNESEEPIVQKSHQIRGILGAFVGAVLGGLICAFICAAWEVVFFFSMAIWIMSFLGYDLFGGKESVLGNVACLVFSVAMVFPATYLGYGWNYFCMINRSVGGYIPLLRVLRELPSYLITYEKWYFFKLNAGSGIGFLLICAIGIIVQRFSEKKKFII